MSLGPLGSRREARGPSYGAPSDGRVATIAVTRACAPAVTSA